MGEPSDEGEKKKKRRAGPGYISSKAYPHEEKHDASEEPVPFSEYPFGLTKKVKLLGLCILLLAGAAYLYLNPSLLSYLLELAGSTTSRLNETAPVFVPYESRNIPYILDFPERNIYLPQTYEGIVNESNIGDPLREYINKGWDIIYVDVPEFSNTTQNITVQLIGNTTFSSGQEKSWRQIWPFWAEVGTCKDENGTARSSKGRDSANFFALNGCAMEKSYYVQPRTQVRFHVYTDPLPGGPCIYPDFDVFEQYNGTWTPTQRFNFTQSPGLDVQQDYMANSTTIKVYADRCFYLEVFQFV